MRSPCGDSERGRPHTHRPPCHLRVTHLTSLGPTSSVCKVGTRTPLTGLRSGRCSLAAAGALRCLPPPGSRGSWREAGLGCQHPSCFGRGGPSPLGWQGTSWARGGRTLPHPSLPRGPQEGDGAAGPQWLPGPARASVPGNILAQNYIRLKVSIFCAILLPDLIVHLWQCLYTSPVRDNSVAAATGVRQRCNLEISGARACLFQGETPALSPGREPCPLPRDPPIPALGSAPFSPQRSSLVPQSRMEVQEPPCHLRKLLD